MKPIAAALFATLALGGAAVAQDQPAPVVVPIKAVTLSDGAKRFTIPITVGSTQIEAGLDTGSSGLRVLPNVLAAGDAQETRRGDTYAYGSGAKLDGVVGEAKLAIGAALAASSTLQVVKTIGCVARLPQCPVSKVAAKDYGIQGDGLRGEGFKAIIGVNMAEAEIRSPLIAIGAKRWIIELPMPGSSEPGRMILNPSPEQMAGYTMFPITEAYRDQHGGMHDSIAGCLLNERNKQQTCGPTLLDSGAPGLHLVNADVGSQWPDGTPVTLAFVQGEKPVMGMKIATGRRDISSHLEFVRMPNAPGVRLQVGLTPFYAFSVLYDPQAAAIGLKSR